MNKNKKLLGITFVEDGGGDWVGVYDHENLIYQGHSVSAKHLLDALGIPYGTLQAAEQLAEDGCCPEKLSEVREDD